MKAVEVEGLTAGYGTGADLFHHPDRAVLHDLSLSLEEGVPVTLLGPNGCGKTTFLRTLIGLLPYQGHVKIFGRELSKMKRKEIALNMAMIPSFRTSISAILSGRPWRWAALSAGCGPGMTARSWTAVWR